MDNFNFVIIEGILKNDSKLISGQYMFTIMSKRNITHKSGEKIEEHTDFDIICEKKLGDTYNKYLKKGNRVLVSGNLTKKYIEGSNINFLT